MNTEMMFERTQKIVMIKTDARVPKIIIERNGNYASYSTWLELDDALPQAIQTMPMKMFSIMVCGLYDEGYKIAEQKDSDEDLK